MTTIKIQQNMRDRLIETSASSTSFSATPRCRCCRWTKKSPISTVKSSPNCERRVGPYPRTISGLPPPRCGSEQRCSPSIPTIERSAALARSCSRALEPVRLRQISHPHLRLRAAAGRGTACGVEPAADDRGGG